MKEIYELIEKSFFSFGNGISLVLEITSVICIAVGLVVSIMLAFKLMKDTKTPFHNRMRMKFGGWLALALEFQLASDIVKTTVSPTYENLIIVGAVAVIRTFLNYFLSREMKEEMESQRIFTEPKIKSEN
jgi:uncharacterized membrane protein